MTPETIGITITYKEPVTFHLRMIGIEEENQLRQKTFGLSDAEKAEKQYQANVDLLADLSADMPKGLFANKPEDMTRGEQAVSDTTFIEDFNRPADAVRRYFAEKTVTKERIAEYAVRAYFLRLQPEVSFF